MQNRLVLAQLAVAEKSNEITAVPELLRTLELAGCLVTVDALNCQKNIAKKISEVGADYVLALKGNHRTLHAKMQTFLDDVVTREFRGVPHQFIEMVDGEHGRVETRRYGNADLVFIYWRQRWARSLQWGHDTPTEFFSGRVCQQEEDHPAGKVPRPHGDADSVGTTAGRHGTVLSERRARASARRAGADVAIYFLQQWYGLADAALEDALYDSQALRGFARIDLTAEGVPDATTLLKFRRLLETHDLCKGLFAAINADLTARGLLLREGTLVDATLIAAASSTKNEAKQRDPEMHQTKKGNQWYFGMKAHIGADGTASWCTRWWSRRPTWPT